MADSNKEDRRTTEERVHNAWGHVMYSVHGSLLRRRVRWPKNVDYSLVQVHNRKMMEVGWDPGRRMPVGAGM